MSDQVPAFVIHKNEFLNLRKAGNMAGLDLLLRKEVSTASKPEPAASYHSYIAACKEKLGDLPGARTHALEALRVNPNSVMGYLRLAKVEATLGNYKRVNKVYVTGMSRFEKGSKCYKLLEETHREFVKKVTGEAKRRDPLQIFPAEVIDMIFKALPFKNFVTMIRVSKSWRYYFTSRSYYWKTLDFTAAQRPITLPTIDHYTKFGRIDIKNLLINNAKFDNDALMPLLVRRCPELATLRINDPHKGMRSALRKVAPKFLYLSHIYIGGSINLHTIAALIQHCPQLTVLECMQVNSEQALELKWHPCQNRMVERLVLKAADDQTFGLHRLKWEDLAFSLPDLYELELINWHRGVPIDSVDFRNFPKLEHLVIEKCGLEELPALPPTIKLLRMSRMPRLKQFWADYLDETPNFFGNLTHLDLDSLPGFKLRDLEQLFEDVGKETPESAEKKATLQVLRLSHLPQITWTPKELASKFDVDELHELSLTSSCEVTNYEVGEFSAFTSLRKLNIAHSHINGVGLLTLYKALELTLEELDITGLEGVSEDTLAFFKKKGIKITKQPTVELKGGKKIVPW